MVNVKTIRMKPLSYKKLTSFNIQHLKFKIIVFAFIIILSSCSVQKQIARSAKENVLSNKALATAHVGISIYDPDANKYWFNYQGDKYFVPASNTKIPTCYAAMKYLGDSLVGLRILVDKDSSLFIEPTGDPTFLHPDFKKQPVYELLQNQKKDIHVLNSYSTNFQFSYGKGWQIDDVNETYLVPRSIFPIYGNLVTFFFNNQGEISTIPKIFKNNVVSDFPCTSFKRIKKFDVYENRYHIYCDMGSVLNKSIQAPFNPTSGLLFLDILPDTIHKKINFNYPSNYSNNNIIFKNFYSQPTDSLLKPMMHRSDNFFAEQSLLMVSNEMLGVMNDEKIIDTLLKTDFKDLPQKPRWVDGSGLSRYNLFTPQDFVAILNKMKNEFGMERIKVILPTGGEGTISSYYKADSGYIYGKTGTLSGVVAFSGFLYTKKGKLLIFSTLVNNHQASATDVRRAVEKFLLGIRNNY